MKIVYERDGVHDQAIPFVFLASHDKWIVVLADYDYTPENVAWMRDKIIGDCPLVLSIDVTYKEWECDSEDEALRLVASLWANWLQHNWHLTKIQ